MKRQELCIALVALVALTIRSNVFADVTDGLIGYWPFNEGQGNVARDVLGGHDGDIQGATWTNDAKSGEWALTFAPDDDITKDGTRVVVPNAEELDNLPNGHSVANWIWPVGRGAMMDKSGTAAERMQWFFFDPGTIHWGVGADFSFTNEAIPFGEWSHVAWSHSPELSVVYIDGEPATPAEEGWGPMIPTGEPMIFGRSGVIATGSAKQQNVEGSMDDFGFWNRPLSADEIREVYNKGIAVIIAAVSPRGKLATTWAAVKSRD